MMHQKYRIWPLQTTESHTADIMCVRVYKRDTHNERKNTEEKNKTWNEKETHDKTALRKEEIMTEDLFCSVQNLQEEIIPKP